MARWYSKLLEKESDEGGSVAKYRNRKVELDGRSFQSKGEANCYLFLKEKKLTEIVSCQKSIYLSAARIQYIVDFELLDTVTQEIYYAEFKGFELPSWRIKRRLWAYYGPGKLEVYKANRSITYLNEVIVPKDTCPQCLQPTK